jgi:hypothetical protein
MSEFSSSRARSWVTSQNLVASSGFSLAAVGARSPIRASAEPMAIKGHGPKLKEIFNNRLPRVAPIEIA